MLTVCGFTSPHVEVVVSLVVAGDLIVKASGVGFEECGGGSRRISTTLQAKHRTTSIWTKRSKGGGGLSPPWLFTSLLSYLLSPLPWSWETAELLH